MENCPLSNTPCPNSKKFELIQTDKGETVYVNVCEKCAYNALKENSQKNLDLLMSMIEEVSYKYYNKKCSGCNLTYQEIIGKSRLGCEFCYESFKSQIVLLIKRCQVSTNHIGKRPRFLQKHILCANINKEIDVLQERIKEAVSIENYEYAAELKERIKKLQDKKATNEI